MTEHELASHNVAQERSQKQCPQPIGPWELSFGMRKDAYESSYCCTGKPSMLLVTFRHSRNFIHCVADIQGRELFCNTPLYLHAACNSEELQGAFPQSLYSPDLPPSDYHLFGFVKGQM
jgi:hypothetical protein